MRALDNLGADVPSDTECTFTGDWVGGLFAHDDTIGESLPSTGYLAFVEPISLPCCAPLHLRR